MSVLLLVFRVLLVLLLLRLVSRAVAAFLRGLRSAAEAPRGELVRDRVCNTFLPRERALHAVVGGQEEHFCSPVCRDRALQAGTA